MAGQTLSTTNPPQTQFSEDDTLAMEDLCKILHSVGTYIPSNPIQALQLVCLANLYDLVKAIKSSVILWAMLKHETWVSRDVTSDVSTQELRAFLFIAYVYDPPSIFAAIVRRFLHETNPSVSFAPMNHIARVSFGSG